MRINVVCVYEEGVIKMRHLGVEFWQGPLDEEAIAAAFRRHVVLNFVLGDCEGGDDEEICAVLLGAFQKARTHGVDLSEILVHSRGMRERVEEIQTVASRDRATAAASFLMRRVSLEEGDLRESLGVFFESTFRLQRGKEVEDCLIAGRSEEAERDLRTLDEDARTWASWMLDAFPELMGAR